MAVTPAALGQGSALVETEQGIAGLDFELLEDIRRRLVFDDDGDVLHLGAKAPRDPAQGLLDETGEVFAANSRWHYLVCRGAAPPRPVPRRFAARRRSDNDPVSERFSPDDFVFRPFSTRASSVVPEFRTREPRPFDRLWVAREPAATIPIAAR